MQLANQAMKRLGEFWAGHVCLWRGNRWEPFCWCCCHNLASFGYLKQFWSPEKSATCTHVSSPFPRDQNSRILLIRLGWWITKWVTTRMPDSFRNAKRPSDETILYFIITLAFIALLLKCLNKRVNLLSRLPTMATEEYEMNCLAK